jgi:hypothetical protein
MESKWRYSINQKIQVVIETLFNKVYTDLTKKKN